jgi:transcriptional regulator with XRE-family HTH domain
MDNQLYSRRKELSLTLEQVGELCEVGKSTVRKWETGQINNMGRDKIIKLAKALKVSPLFVLQADCSERILSTYDMKLLSYTDKLTDIGKRKVLNYADDLSTNPTYQNSNDNNIINAAHERTDIELTLEGQNHDTKIMTDDEEWE